MATAEHVEACLQSRHRRTLDRRTHHPNPFSVQEMRRRGENGCPRAGEEPGRPRPRALDAVPGTPAQGRCGTAGRRASGFQLVRPHALPQRPDVGVPHPVEAAFPDLGLLCDPSHIAGSRSLLGAVAQQALDLNFSGLMVETHCDPQCPERADQQIDPGTALIEGSSSAKRSPDAALKDRLRALSRPDRPDRRGHRAQAGARLDIAERIGEYKAEHNVAILQPERWEAILSGSWPWPANWGWEAFVEPS